MPWNKTPEELAQKLKKYIRQSEENIVLVLHRIGQEAVNWARKLPSRSHGGPSYEDRTGNLRNSIGYAIFKDGKLYDFVLDDRGHSQAQSQSQSFINSFDISKLPQRGYALVVYAGMEYGIYVEAKGYTVLTGALENSPTAKVLEQAIKKVIKKVKE